MSLLNQASLIQIPSGYKEDTLYSAKPINGDGDLSFTRASNGTRINSEGLVEVVPLNLVEYSEQFDNAYWAKPGATITANDTTAPNGVATADKVLANSGNTEHGVYNGTPIASNFVGEVYTYSVYAKKGTVDFLVLDHYQGSYTFTWFNLNTGTVGTVASGVTATIESVGNGWYRCSCTKAITATAVNFIGIYLSNANNTWSFNAAGTESIYIWGAQVNIGSTSKTYFPTTDRLNVPRLTYQNGGGGCPSLLLEPQRTNKALYSESFDNAGWNKSAATITANAVTSPDGYTNADSFLPTATTSAHSVDPAPLLDLLGVVGTFSVFAKYNGYHLSLSIAGTSANWTGCVFDLQNGIARTPQNGSVQGLCTSKIEDYGNGWYRCSITYTPYTSGTFYNFIGAVSTNNATLGNFGLQSFAANGTSGVYLYGAQIETSASYPTSYIPTTSSSVTRVADACSKTGISSLIGQTEGTLFVEVDKTARVDNDFRFQISDGTTNNWLFVGVEVGNNIRLYCNVGGVNQFSVYGAVVTNGIHKVAIVYKANDFKVYVDGVAWITQTSGSVPACSRLDIGCPAPTTDAATDSKTNQALLFPTRLTNAELASLTTL